MLNISKNKMIVLFDIFSKIIIAPGIKMHATEIFKDGKNQSVRKEMYKLFKLKKNDFFIPPNLNSEFHYLLYRSRINFTFY